MVITSHGVTTNDCMFATADCWPSLHVFLIMHIGGRYDGLTRWLKFLELLNVCTYDYDGQARMAARQ